nr:hypothetical protein [Mycobacterium arosiense]
MVELFQLGFQLGDLVGSGPLRLGQCGGDVLQVGTDFGQLLGLRAKRFGGALHLSGFVDRAGAVLMIPGGVEALLRLRESVIGLGGVPTRPMEGLRQTCDLGRATGLQGSVYRPRVAAGRRDQLRDAEMLQLHRMPMPGGGDRSAIPAAHRSGQRAAARRQPLAIRIAAPARTAERLPPRGGRAIQFNGIGLV